MAKTKKRGLHRGEDSESDYLPTEAAARKRRRTRTPKGKASISLFVALPGELRNRIYELALPAGDTIRIRERRHGLEASDREPGRPVLFYYERNEFIITTTTFNVDKALAFLTAKSDPMKLGITMSWAIRLVNPRTDVGEWWSIAQAMYSTNENYTARLHNIPYNPRGTPVHAFYASQNDYLLAIEAAVLESRKEGKTHDDLIENFIQCCMAKDVWVDREHLCRALNTAVARSVYLEPESDSDWPGQRLH